MKPVVYFLTILFIVTSCGDTNNEGVLDRETINTGNRETTDLKAAEIIFLGQYNFFANYLIKVDDKNIYLADTDKEKILRINKKDHEDYKYIGRGAGNGAGEIAKLQSFDVANDKIVIFDRENEKLVYFTTTGQLLKEYKVSEDIDRPHKVAISSDYSFILSPETNESIFYKLDDSGNVIKGFEKPSFDPDPPFVKGVHSMLVYQGYICSDSLNNFYFSNYVESVLRKYNRKGSLVYSVNKIESKGRDIQDYAAPNPDRRIYLQYAESAQFSSRGLTVDKNVLGIIKYDNTDNSNTNLVDIYSADNGEYIKTYALEYSPTDIAINDGYIYSVRYVDDKPAIVKYKM